MKKITILPIILIAVIGCILFRNFFISINDAVVIFMHNISETNLIIKLIPYHKYIKILLMILAAIPLLQTSRLLKTRSAKDVSVMYQFFTITVITCINIDIFRSQFGKADVNSFIIFCRYGKVFFYNINILLIFALLNKLTKTNLFIIGCFFLTQIFIILGIFMFPKIMFNIVCHEMIGIFIAIIFAIGMFKPTLQIIKTIKKKTANDVSMSYYLAFFTFVFLSIIDSFIMFQISGISVPIRTTMANCIKMCLYLATFITIFYIRYVYKNSKNI